MLYALTLVTYFQNEPLPTFSKVHLLLTKGWFTLWRGTSFGMPFGENRECATQYVIGRKVTSCPNMLLSLILKRQLCTCVGRNYVNATVKEFSYKIVANKMLYTMSHSSLSDTKCQQMNSPQSLSSRSNQRQQTVQWHVICTHSAFQGWIWILQHTPTSFPENSKDSNM